MAQSEIRQNKATNQWVIFAPSRGKRPHDFVRDRTRKALLPEHAEACPFCPGNEHLLPPIIMEMPGPEVPWQTRVVPNKFPALTPTEETARREEGIYLAMGGFGHHDVIIESPRHDQQVAAMGEDSVARVIETYHRRYSDILKDDETMMAVIFRNHGLRAGTSLIHPHSQLIATGWVPSYIRWREDAAERYFDQSGRCVYCDIMNYEITAGARLVYDNRSFVAFVPYAAEVPFEIWIVPRNHQADFGDISDIEKDDLSAALRHVLGILFHKLNDPDYNYVINTAARHKSGEPHLHWHLQIRPRLTTRAGFEIGSGISINPTFPEDDAEFLRNPADGQVLT
jgi:UDPglucose--hexose-1-phosphate uridylyltransferase